jgi:hypothetical protein
MLERCVRETKNWRAREKQTPSCIRPGYSGCRLEKEEYAERNGLVTPLESDEVGRVRSHFLPTYGAIVLQQPASTGLLVSGDSHMPGGLFLSPEFVLTQFSS